MEKQRDSKGRFVKGNKEGFGGRGTEEVREINKQGGVASGIARREKKMLKEVLKEVLLEKVEMVDSVGRRIELTKQEVIVQNVLNRMQKKGSAKDLKILAEILGEMEINVNLTQSEKPVIMFDDGEDNV